MNADEIRKMVEAFIEEHDLGPVVFYTQEEWEGRGESYGNGAILSLTCEEGGLNGVLNRFWETQWMTEVHDKWDQMFHEHGLIAEMGYSWSVHVYKPKKTPKAQPYPETHMEGTISIENPLESDIVEGDFGIRIAEDGRVWVCVNGVAFIRFKPKNKRR